MTFQEFSEKLLKYFNGTIISKSFSLPSVHLVIFTFVLNDSESAKLSLGSPLIFFLLLVNGPQAP